jgi:DNA primase
MISEEKLTEIRERLPLSELVGEYVQLKKSGKSHRGLCPFHQERTPSFYVNDDRESFHCFGCGTGGDLFEFLKQIEGISFPDAVTRLAERVGIQLDWSHPDESAAYAKKKREIELLRQAAWYYHCLLKNLPEDHEVHQYLRARHLDLEMVEGFFLGFCPAGDSGLQDYLKKKGFSLTELRACHLFNGTREFFRGRLIFPIFRQDKKVVGFGGRILNEKDGGPKYLNSPESDLFKKGELFYGLDLAKSTLRKTGQALVVEGYFDVITLHAQGFVQAVAPLGTALTGSQAKILTRLVEEITLLFDSDAAGSRATLKALEVLLPMGALPKRVHLEGGEDPDSYLNRYGKLALGKKLEERRNLLEELIDKGASEMKPASASLEKKGQAAGQLLRLIEKFPDSITQNLYRRRLAEAFEIPEEWLQGRGQTRSGTPRPSGAARPSWLPEEEAIVELWLKFPELRDRIRAELPLEDLCTPAAQDLLGLFWSVPGDPAEVSTGKYFDLAPQGLLEVLTELALRSSGLEETGAAERHLAQSILRLKERRLRQDLEGLKDTAARDQPELLQLVQQKIQALSLLLKTKEGNDGQS